MPSADLPTPKAADHCPAASPPPRLPPAPPAPWPPAARNRFAIVTVAIISGAVVGKIKYAWFMAFAALWHLLIYCPLAHWIFFYDG